MQLPTEPAILAHGIVHWDEPLIRMGQLNQLYVLVTCNDCGKDRRVNVHELTRTRRSDTGRCLPCHRKDLYPRLNNQRGRAAKTYKGPTRISPDGYRWVGLYPGDAFYESAPMRNGDGYVRYILEHRLILTQQCGHPLATWEHVHHKDGDKLNNAPSNLEIVSNSTHSTITALRTENERLCKENADLLARLNQLSPPS